MLNDRASPLSLLATRRSGKPRDMVTPGPDAAQLRAIVEMGTRVPDHGKLAPWRFVHVEAGQREAFSALLVATYRADKPEAGRQEIEAAEAFARQAPTLLVALFSPRPGKIPLWEQELSCGAAVMTLVHAATAHGFVAGWLTGWAAYSDRVRDAFGGPEERIAGFLFIGSPGRELEERPRPLLETVLSDWTG